MLHTVSNPFQQIRISALRPRVMATCCRVTNSSFFWHGDAVRVNTTGSDSTQQTLPDTGGAFDWWPRGAVCFFCFVFFSSSEPFLHVSRDWFQPRLKSLSSCCVYLFMLPYLLTPEEKLQMGTFPLTKCFTVKVMFTGDAFGFGALTRHL